MALLLILGKCYLSSMALLALAVSFRTVGLKVSIPYPGLYRVCCFSFLLVLRVPVTMSWEWAGGGGRGPMGACGGRGCCLRFAIYM